MVAPTHLVLEVKQQYTDRSNAATMSHLSLSLVASSRSEAASRFVCRQRSHDEVTNPWTECPMWQPGHSHRPRMLTGLVLLPVYYQGNTGGTIILYYTIETIITTNTSGIRRYVKAPHETDVLGVNTDTWQGTRKLNATRQQTIWVSLTVSKTCSKVCRLYLCYNEDDS